MVVTRDGCESSSPTADRSAYRLVSVLSRKREPYIAHPHSTSRISTLHACGLTPFASPLDPCTLRACAQTACACNTRQPLIRVAARVSLALTRSPLHAHTTRPDASPSRRPHVRQRVALARAVRSYARQAMRPDRPCTRIPAQPYAHTHTQSHLRTRPDARTRSHMRTSSAQPRAPPPAHAARRAFKTPRTHARAPPQRRRIACPHSRLIAPGTRRP